jgi:hypothetical protein
MGKYKRRYEVAEEILARGGTDKEIQRRIMEEFPNSRENPTRARWYRRSWNKYGHCRGDGAKSNRESRGDTPSPTEPVQAPQTPQIQPAAVSQSPFTTTADAASLSTLENEWLGYAWSVLTDAEHIRQCEQNGGAGIEDRSLRWPGYLGTRYRAGGLLLVANIHRDFASGGADADLATRLVECTRKWRDTGRSEASDRDYLSANRACYVEGLQSWTVGGWFAKFLDRAGLEFEDVTYLNAARCQSLVDACQSLQRLCLRRFPLQHLEATLQPSLVLTSSTVVREEARLAAPVRWFHQRNGRDQNGRPFDEWSGMVLAEFADG